MKRFFLGGMLAGCVFSALVFTGYYEATNLFSKKNIISAEVQQQIMQNIQDINKILIFADDNLAEYTEHLHEIREVLIEADDKKYLSKEEKQKIINLSEKCLQIIEEAKFNTIPVFFNNCNGEYSRVIPVTLDAAKPSYKINISCIKFNRNVITSFINNLTQETGLKNNLTELDKILSAVALERAQLGAYQNRLTYSLETATALSKDNLHERHVEINKIVQKVKTEQLVLCVQSANGIYCSEDRQQIQLSFDELNDELNRICVLSQKPIAKNSSISLLSQHDAEKAMIFLAKKL